MSTFSKGAFALSVSVGAMMVAAPALAADAAADQAPSANNTAEIIVTAQKRPERLQDIPVAAAVLGAQAVAQAHVSDLSDINRVVPSVEIKGTFNGRVPYGIRGISTNANEGAIGLTSGVSIQVDGVPVPADSFAVNTITDVSQLEVLKGPQATLGGRTASAGVINFVTYGPTSKPQFGFNTLLTDDGEWHADVRASGPLTDTLSASLTAYYQRTPYPVYNITTGVKSHAQSYGTRAKLKWQATDNIDVQLMGHYALSTSAGENFTVQYFTPGAVFFAPPLGLNAADMYPGYTIGYGNTKLATHNTMTSRYEDYDTSGVINWHLGSLTLTSTTAYSREKQFQTQEVFMANDPDWSVKFANFLELPAVMSQPFNNLQSAQGYVEQVTQEFKLATDASRPVSAIAGLFYSDMTVNQYGLRSWALNPIAKTNIATTRNYAIYARATAHLTDKITAVGGLRYNWDKIGWNVTQYFNPAAGQYGSGG
ncbi:MAG TPA: TonB-dependent receptor, partial [Novosphingobium sp.]|nr:TonB-dependent receptor [Novosphingobium sp.]